MNYVKNKTNMEAKSLLTFCRFFYQALCNIFIKKSATFYPVDISGVKKLLALRSYINLWTQ